MTNDELLSGFLDRSLSEDSLLEFEARRQSSPEFAQEVQEMLAVESALATAAPVFVIPTGFLEHVENAVAGKVAAGSSVSAGLFSGLNTAWTWVGAAALAALGTAALVYVNSTSSPDVARPRVASPDVAVPTVASPDVAVPTVASPDVAVPTVASPDVSRPRVAVPTVASPDVARPRVSSPDASSSTASFDIENQSNVIASLRADLDKCIAQNNTTQCAQIARTLGMKLRTTGAFDESKVYLQQSLNIARSMHLVQYEVNALGELGLLARDRGNATEARSLLQEALTKAAGGDAGSVAQYEKALRELGQ